MDNLSFHCSKCGESLECDTDMAGQIVECPSCKGSIRIPYASTIVPSKTTEPPPLSDDTDEPLLDAEEDDVEEEIADPSEYVKEFQRSLANNIEEMQSAGDMKMEISKADEYKIMDFVEANAVKLSADEYDFESLIIENFPKLLTAEKRAEMREWKKFAIKNKDTNDKTQLMGTYAPDLSDKLSIPKRAPTEPPATEKQKKYLLRLGFHNQSLLESLGVRQASSMIDQALQYREK